ncbi:DUF4190 domain-containing protein [Phycisphaerales bacterium AB-hyl4]|uniref:DUF4190 domain-containing protein n=1 Tax=Natronomicrosphaera hydrolytica TaxID=3242702 RepID=A0ABV4U2S2_9BACT
MSQLPPPPPPVAAETSGKAVAALVCSIVGFFTCPIILHVLGIILGNMALGEIRLSHGRLTGEGVARAGVIIGWIGLALVLLTFCLMMTAAFASVLLGGR